MHKATQAAVVGTAAAALLVSTFTVAASATPENAAHHTKPKIVNVTAVTGSDDGTMNVQWARNTSDNVNRTGTVHRIGRAGVHVLKFWMVDPTVVLQNLVVDTGGLKPSYLGPQESLRLK